MSKYLKVMFGVKSGVSDFEYKLDINDIRFYHEIYLSDSRICDVNKLKIVIIHPIKKIK